MDVDVGCIDRLSGRWRMNGKDHVASCFDYLTIHQSPKNRSLLNLQL